MSCDRLCNQGRLCPGRHGSGRSCDELGVCKSLPGCPDAARHTAARHDAGKLPPGGHWFSPGSLDGPHRKARAAGSRRVAVALYLVASGLSLAATLGFAAGYLHLPGMLP